MTAKPVKTNISLVGQELFNSFTCNADVQVPEELQKTDVKDDIETVSEEVNANQISSLQISKW